MLWVCLHSQDTRTKDRALEEILIALTLINADSVNTYFFSFAISDKVSSDEYDVDQKQPDCSVRSALSRFLICGVFLRSSPRSLCLFGSGIFASKRHYFRVSGWHISARS